LGTDVIVQTQVISATNAPPINAGWRVRSSEGQPKIIDVLVEGVSMAQNQRQEFTAIVSREGIPGLLQSLRSKISTLSAAGG
jgi:phospholipid transport system substrate-binding protein